MGHLALVVERRGDGFVLEFDMAKTLRPHGVFELGTGPAVGFEVVIDEVHRPADHGAVELGAEIGLAVPLQLADETTENAREGHDLALDADRFTGEVGAEDALQRPEQPPVASGDIFGDGTATEQHLVTIEIEEHGAWNGDAIALERQQARPVGAVCRAEGGIGRAEIEAAVHGDVLSWLAAGAVGDGARLLTAAGGGGKMGAVAGRAPGG